jgi:hypothetical protein
MKKALLTLLLATLGLGAASCSEETEQTPTGGIASVSFSVSTPKAPLVLTRAIASTYEWNIATLDIYAADEDGVMEKLTEDDFTISPALSSAPNQTYTVTLSPTWLNPRGGQTMNFYIVANDATSTNGEHTALSATDEADFVNALTEALTDNGDGTQKPITSPDGTTANLLFSADMPGVLIANTVKEQCQLKRREARFDIQNRTAAPGDDQLIITGIEVINAPEAGLVFGAGDAATQEAIDRTKNIELPGLVEADYTETAPDSEISNDLATSVFYLYPTTLVSPGADATAGKTQIIVTGTYDGETVKYPVEVPMETAIQANFRYILNIDATTATIQLKGSEYEEGDTIEASPINNVKASFTPEIAQITGAGFYSTVSSMHNVFASTDPDVRSTMPFTVVSQVGTHFTFLPKDTEMRLNKVSTVTPVDDDFIVTEVFTVMIPAGEGPLEAMLVIDSGKDREGNLLGADTVYIRRLEPPVIEAPAEPYVVYYDPATKSLQLSDWSEPLTRAAQQDNAMAFKFGSVVGTDMTTAAYSASAVMFNPMADSLAVTDDWSTVPSYEETDFPNVVSTSIYHNYENLMLGKGDPCKLIGLTEEQIKQGLIDNKRFRLPTREENESQYLLGSTITGDFAANSTTSGIYFGDEASTFLPAAGRRAFDTGALENQGSNGYWLSGTPDDDVPYASRLSFNSSTVNNNNHHYEFGTTIRCVDTPLPLPGVDLSDPDEEDIDVEL